MLHRYTKLCNPVKKQAAMPTQIELYDLGQDPAEVRDRWAIPIQIQLAPGRRWLRRRSEGILTTAKTAASHYSH